MNIELSVSMENLWKNIFRHAIAENLEKQGVLA